MILSLRRDKNRVDGTSVCKTPRVSARKRSVPMNSKHNAPVTKKIAVLLPIIFLIVIASCSKRNEIRSGSADTNIWVSVGQIHTEDLDRRLVVFGFFTSNNIPSYPEGWPTCEVMVPKQDFDRVRTILSVTHPSGTDFVSIWDEPKKDAN